jgi:hypothetical protein
MATAGSRPIRIARIQGPQPCCIQMAKPSRPRPPHSASCVIGLLLVCWVALSPAHAVEDANCSELERSFDLIKTDIASHQLNSVLFSAAAMGCQELGGRWLARGARSSLCDAARACGARRSARNGRAPAREGRANRWPGHFRRYRGLPGRRERTAGDRRNAARKGRRSQSPGPIGSKRRSRPRPSKATIASLKNCCREQRTPMWWTQPSRRR